MEKNGQITSENNLSSRLRRDESDGELQKPTASSRQLIGKANDECGALRINRALNKLQRVTSLGGINVLGLIEGA